MCTKCRESKSFQAKEIQAPGYADFFLVLINQHPPLSALAEIQLANSSVCIYLCIGIGHMGHSQHDMLDSEIEKHIQHQSRNRKLITVRDFNMVQADFPGGERESGRATGAVHVLLPGSSLFTYPF